MGNSRWNYKIISKNKVAEYVSKFRTSLYIEIIHQSKPGYHLILHTTSGEKILGRVSKNIFKWYETEPTKSQSGYMNISWHKFKSPNT